MPSPRRSRRISRYLSLAAVAVMGLGAAGAAQAGSYNWGDNGYGACQNNDGVSDWTVTNNCLQSLSGWVTVKPWTIYNATATCEDILTGPYPTASNFGGGFAYSGQAFLALDTTGSWPSNGATVSSNANGAGSHGIAWQGGSDIGSDVAEVKTIQLGNWDLDVANAPTTWGTAVMAFGNSDLFASQSAQYAMACLAADDAIGQNDYYSGGGVYTPNERTPSGTVAMAREHTDTVRHNPRPAERNHVVRHADAAAPTVTRWRRITLQRNVQRTVRMACPGGYRRSGQVEVTPEHAPRNMKPPTTAQVRNTTFSLLRRSHDRTGATVRVKASRLPVTTMLNMHLTCVKG